MKPIRLEIEGLNSYYKKQIIDFELLTSKGIFGIFGKTGSGKSTILDAITLSLYGNIARGTKEFINVNSNKASIEYEFQIMDGLKRHTYIVSRRFKRKSGDTKSSSRSDYVRLMKKNSDGEFDVIADKVGEVNQAIKEIIGLEESDFLKSVVLPQGKFSEFLVLGGKDRRNMLERIFNLEEYGTVLNAKILKKRTKVNSELDILNARLSEYSGVTIEYKNELENNISMLSEEIYNLNSEIEMETNLLEEYKYIFNLCLDNVELNKELEILENKKSDIDDKKNSLDMSKRASLILPSIITLEENILKISKNNEIINSLKLKIEDINSRFDYEQEQFESFAKKKSRLPYLTVLKKDIQIMNEKLAESINNTNKENSLKIILKEIEEKLIFLINKKEQMEVDVNLLEKNKNELEINLNKNKVDKKYRDTINKCKELCGELDRFKNDKSILEKESADEIKVNYDVRKKIETLDSKLSKKDEEIGNIIELMTEQECIEILDEVEFEKIENQINLCNKEIYDTRVLENKLKEIDFNLNELYVNSEAIKKDMLIKKDKLKELDSLINENTIKKEKIDFENLANKVKIDWSNHFNSGDRCPICNSIVDKIELQSIEVKNDYQKILENLNIDRQNTALSINSLDTNINLIEKTINSYIKEKASIILKLNGKKSSDIEAGKQRYEKYKNEQRKLKELVVKNISDLKEKKRCADQEKNEIEKEKIQLTSILERSLSNISRAEKKLIILSENIDDISLKLMNLIKEYSILDIESEISRIEKMETSYESISIELNDINKIFEKSKEKLSSINNEIVNLNYEQKVQNKYIDDVKKQHCLLEEEVKNIFYSINWEELDFLDSKFKNIGNFEYVKNKSSSYVDNLSNYDLKYVINSIDEYELYINSKYDLLSEVVNTIKETRDKLLDEYKSNVVENNIINEHVKKIQIDLQDTIEKNNFDTIDSVKSSVISNEDTKKLEHEIDTYENRFNELSIRLYDNIKKLKGRSITKTELDDKIEKVKKIKADVDDEKNKKSGFEAILEEVLKKLDLAGNINQEITKKQKEKDTIDSLEKVMRGNKFVEFLSQMYLNSIVIDASKRLDSITKGRYALEINSDYMFIIRDNYNGGQRRSADTLSGGETFLASLSLALALSSQIQLKGNAPLEFFFLDEGFGTLDSDLLDIVMESLENLKSDTLSIGVISHMEEMKNRIPIKLLVEVDNVDNSSITRIELS